MAYRWLQFSWTVLFLMTGLILIDSLGWNPFAIPYWAKQIPHELWSPLIGAAATFVAALFGAVVVAWQIGRQAKIAINQSRETEQVKLKLKIYEDAIGVVEDAVNASVIFTGLLDGILTELDIAVFQQKNGFPAIPPKLRFPRIMQATAAHSAAYIKIVSTVERWQIIDPRILIFRTAISQALSEVSAKQSTDFNRRLMMALPTDDGGGGKFPYTVPDEASLSKLKTLCADLMESLRDIQAYAHDFQIEMQNLLLSNLFSNRLSARKPLDPSLVAVSLDRYDELNDHFLNRTEWGKSQKAIEVGVRARFAEKAEP